MMAYLMAGVLLLSSIPTASAKAQGRAIEYRDGDAVLEGYVAYPSDAKKAARGPGVLVIHEWMGINDYVKKRVDQLADLGYVAFAADIYGKGIRPTTTEEAAKLSGEYKAGDRAKLRARAEAALKALSSDKRVEPDQLVAIGYCFGGTAALELARAGAPLKGVVSFHGGLDTPRPADARNIKGRVLALTGAADPNVPREQVQAFQDEMSKAKVDWQLVAYGGAVHSFTNPAAGNDPSKGAAYDAKADRRSWVAMKDFFTELFQR